MARTESRLQSLINTHKYYMKVAKNNGWVVRDLGDPAIPHKGLYYDPYDKESTIKIDKISKEYEKDVEVSRSLLRACSRCY